MADWRIGLLTLAALSMPLPSPANGEESDLSELRGLWRPVEGSFDGKALRAEELKQVRLLFAWTVQPKEESGGVTLGPPMVPDDARDGGWGGFLGQFRCHVFPDETPARISFSRRSGFNGSVWYHGIYKVEDDALTVCFDLRPWHRALSVRDSIGAYTPKPDKFNSRAHSGRLLLVLKNHGQGAGLFSGLRPRDGRAVDHYLELLDDEDPSKRLMAVHGLAWHGVAGASESLVLGNVLVGDVWVLGGQSNMEFELAKVENGQLEIVSANDPEIRILTVPYGEGQELRKGFPRLHEWSDWFGRHFRKGDWDVCSPAIAKELSAIGYAFARRVHMASGVPIGVIDASRGGRRSRPGRRSPFCAGWRASSSGRSSPTGTRGSRSGTPRRTWRTVSPSTTGGWLAWSRRAEPCPTTAGPIPRTCVPGRSRTTTIRALASRGCWHPSPGSL